MTPLIPKRYLGDGVYAEIEDGMVKLTTERELPSTTHTIYLEPDVFEALAQFYRDAISAARERSTQHAEHS